MKVTVQHAATDEVLRIPSVLASRGVIADLNAPSLRLALVLAVMAYPGYEARWTVAKPILQQLTAVVLDRADLLLDPVREAMLEIDGSEVRLFEKLNYKPGRRGKTAGMITAQLSGPARDLLQSEEFVVLAADELRRYTTIGGIMLRLRLAGRMQSRPAGKVDTWRLEAEDIAKPEVFGNYGKSAVVRKTNAQGEITEYASLQRAAAVLISRGVEEINAVTRKVTVEMIPMKTGDGSRARWTAIDIETRKIWVPKPKPDPKKKPAKKPGLNALHKASVKAKRSPAFAR